MVKDGDKRVAQALKLYENFDKLISTLLIGNNIVNIAASSVATVFFLDIFPVYGAAISTVITTINLAYIFWSFTKKSLAKMVPEKLALKVTPILTVIMKVFTPFVWIISKIQDLIKSFFYTRKWWS